MTQQAPPPPKSSSRNRNIGIVALVIGLVIGLVFGIFISVFLNLPSSFHTGVGVSNQVQVSGMVSQSDTTDIKFTNLNGTISSTAPIVNGTYSLLLVGGQSYNVLIYVLNDVYGQYTYRFSLYVPLGATTFTANF